MRATGALLASRYRVLRPLGSGGMATVVLCEDERLGREVAVKRLHAHSPQDAARRFAREARLGASLNHPNLVTVYDTITDDEAVLIVMEYVPGLTLREVLRDGPLVPQRAAAVVRDAAAGLDHAHAQGVVHRDVKPANVLLRDDGVAKLVDLGIAVAVDQTRITQSGTVLGTAAYMAPEQLEGSDTGPATDVYALAAVAYEALAGRRARSGRTAVEIAHQVATEPPPNVRDIRPELPAGVDAALQRGMARDPAERPGSAGELAAQLAGALAPTTATQRTRRLPRSTRARAAAHDNGRQRSSPLATPVGEGLPTPSAERAGGGSTGRRRRPAWLAPALIGLAVAAIAAVVLASSLSADDGGDGGSASEQPSARAGDDGRATRAGDAPAKQPASAQPSPPAKAKHKHKPTKDSTPATSAPTPTPTPTDTGYTVPAATGSDPATAAQLNDRGFALMRAGRFDEAVPLLERAVSAADPQASDLTYAYALFNLGSSLRQAGRPEDAIGVLERRLTIPNQTETVRAELERARQEADTG